MKSDSAQITIDYVTGMGIFLLSVAFVFQFMYSLFIPFQSSSDEVTLAADRASTVLVERLLAADRSGAVNVIDREKLYYFNNTKLNHSNEIGYKNALRELGLFSNEIIFDMNMSVAYLNGTIMNQSGPELPENTDIGKTRRLVLIVNSSTGYNETAVISVRVW
ncbi:hypothetical protein ANME2D_01819 [Candidatus Methanoperedens nitroreducens]|uniref:Uncharacterized protein n=1 Tax=Candidatus Methanoperedens nitratireducens TaxID=1392998 RepID=A0A062V7L3_9EURY|nr:hypothetical protein [Candidatus Methanoperedens nitroreducens]KCZ71764.1 hypothetical protein ANME2D_01819 [Candidatus Methanoperedens nitroreducens]MDJ1422263.1 hypothetical protein [Candidatus Methanoperedens sp.]